MRPLFVSLACDYCDGIAPVSYYNGFIVHRDQELSRRVAYVFRTRTDAARYRAAEDLRRCHIREVKTETEIHWKTLTIPHLAGIELADRPFEIFPDHRYEPLPNRAFLVPLERLVAA